MAKAKEAPAVAPELDNTVGQPQEAVINPSSEAGVDDIEEATDVIIAPKGSHAIQSVDEIANLALLDSEEGHGFEKGDVAIPFLRVIQSNSPEVKKQNAKYLEDAEAGMFFNTATKRLWSGDDGLYGVPVHFTRQATLWLPRGEGGGGGFVAELTIPEAEALLKECSKNEKGKDITPPMKLGNMAKAENLELVIAALYYMIVFNPEDPSDYETIAFPLVSTQMKKARQWNTVIRNARLPNPSGVGTFNPAMYAFAYKFTTLPEQNAKGDWMGVKIQQWKPLVKVVKGVGEEQFEGAGGLYLAAREFAALVKSGRAKAQADQEIGDDGGTMAGAGAGAGVEDEKLPF